MKLIRTETRNERMDREIRNLLRRELRRADAKAVNTGFTCRARFGGVSGRWYFATPLEAAEWAAEKEKVIGRQLTMRITSLVPLEEGPRRPRM